MEFYADLGVKFVTTSIEHPETNGQVESTNKFILRQLKRRLGSAKGFGPRSYQRYCGHTYAYLKQQPVKLHSTLHMVLMP